jgi:hypothetical protein
MRDILNYTLHYHNNITTTDTSTPSLKKISEPNLNIGSAYPSKFKKHTNTKKEINNYYKYSRSLHFYSLLTARVGCILLYIPPRRSVPPKNIPNSNFLACPGDGVVGTIYMLAHGDSIDACRKYKLYIQYCIRA